MCFYILLEKFCWKNQSVLQIAAGFGTMLWILHFPVENSWFEWLMHYACKINTTFWLKIYMSCSSDAFTLSETPNKTWHLTNNNSYHGISNDCEMPVTTSVIFKELRPKQVLLNQLPELGFIALYGRALFSSSHMAQLKKEFYYAKYWKGNSYITACQHGCQACHFNPRFSSWRWVFSTTHFTEVGRQHQRNITIETWRGSNCTIDT